IDFIPGEKTVFFDDFSDMAEDEPPPHWKVRGGRVELLTGGGLRQLNILYADGMKISSPTIAIPENFTLESQMVLGDGAAWQIMDKDERALLTIITAVGSPTSLEMAVIGASSEQLADAKMDSDPKKPV